MAKSTAGPPPFWRLLVRIAMVALALVGAAFWRFGQAQLSIVGASVCFWAALEAAIVYKVRAVSVCKNIPFAVRLVCGYGLDIQLAWLSVATTSPAFAGEFDGGLMDNISMVIADSAGRVSLDPVPAFVNTLSVVLPCANEGEYVKKTVKAVFEATPREQLKEIIVIDDASHPPVMTTITEEELASWNARVIRHNTQEGLIRSKKDGGDHAKGDAIVFLDCHVKPMGDWTGPILRNLRENPRRIVVPAITSLDPDTWQEVSPYGGGTKMCLTWDADFFWCNEYPGPYVPIMSGGLLAMTKFWWESIGGYDSEMKAWGGENLDQSLRTWLCGGEIRVAEGSRVAHMWRDPSKPKTMLRYRIPTNDVRRNRLRATVAWLDGWADKVKTFPQFDDFKEGGPLTIGSLENIEHYKKKLKCKPFVHYLNRFKDFYLDTGLIPEQTFNLRERKSGLCVSLKLANGKCTGFYLAPCSSASELQRFHEANLASRKRCCSGIKTWDFDSCLSAWGSQADVTSSGCEHFGTSSAQHFKLSPSGALEWKRGQGCVAPKYVAPTVKRRKAIFAAYHCSSHLVETDKRLRVQSGGLCLQVLGREKPEFVSCSGGEEQLFEKPGSSSSPHVLKSASGVCIRREHGEPAVGSCEEHAQHFRSGAKGELILDGAEKGGLCSAPPEEVAVHFADCVAEVGKPKPGQGWSKYRPTNDGSFMLLEEQLGLCLKPVRQGDNNVLVASPCPGPTDGTREWRWSYDEKGGQLKHVALRMCVDAFDYKEFILYPCYQPGQNMKQHYLMRENGHLEMPRSWADNGRLRYPAQCIDADPIQPVGIQVASCREAQQDGYSWERAWPEVPLETQIWRKAAGNTAFLNRVV